MIEKHDEMKSEGEIKSSRKQENQKNQMSNTSKKYNEYKSILYQLYIPIYFTKLFCSYLVTLYIYRTFILNYTQVVKHNILQLLYSLFIPASLKYQSTSTKSYCQHFTELYSSKILLRSLNNGQQ